MAINLAKAKEILKNGNYTCVITNGESVYTSNDRGVKPLLSWLDDGEDFCGYTAADKVVGKAAAFLYVLLGVDEVYASVISKPSVDVFEKYGIKYSYDTLVDAIRNRTNTGYCPMEQAVESIWSPFDAVSIIEETIDTLSKQKTRNKNGSLV